jgi:hypothetical protein
MKSVLLWERGMKRREFIGLRGGGELAARRVRA